MPDPIDTRAFDFMTTAVDETAVSLFEPEDEKGTRGIHNALLAAGMTPAYGNIADIADATLYALEGEFGEAGWSLASAIPVIGQMVSGKRALKAAKEAGEETIKLFRGTSKWHKGEMVVEGKHVSPTELMGSAGSQPTKRRGIWATDSIEEASIYREVDGSKGIMLEYEVPKSWYESHVSRWNDPNWRGFGTTGWFEEGIPVGFFKKVHK